MNYSNYSSHFSPLFSNNGSILGCLPRKFTYISIASSMPPGVSTYLRNLEATSGLKISPVSPRKGVAIQHFRPRYGYNNRRYIHLPSYVRNKWSGSETESDGSDHDRPRPSPQISRYPNRQGSLSIHDNPYPDKEGGQILRRSEALSATPLNHLVYKGLRYYLAGLVMFRRHSCFPDPSGICAHRLAKVAPQSHEARRTRHNNERLPSANYREREAELMECGLSRRLSKAPVVASPPVQKLKYVCSCGAAPVSHLYTFVNGNLRTMRHLLCPGG